MTFVVPFDGSELAEAALVRATRFGEALDERVLAVSVIPRNNAEYAAERDWIGPEESYDREAIVGTLHERAVSLCPSADFRHETVDRFAPPGTVANTVSRVARDEDATLVFVGSDDAGDVVTSVSSVGGHVASDPAYDVVIVRHREPARIEALRHHDPDPDERSEFYVP